jgi:hypothetical protein
MAMKKGLKARWVAALRSGKYKQGYGELKHENKQDNLEFCCLGVLREISPAVAVRNGDNSGSLEPETLKYTGISPEQQTQLIEMNDEVAGYGFKRIATYIEKNL